MRIIVGTRGSKLALVQTNWVISQLKKSHPDHHFEVKVVKTTGDKKQNVSLDQIGGKGVFVKEIEEQLLQGKIDLAVHSMKDMPGETPGGLMFSWVPQREDFRDALILNKEYTSLEDLPKGATIATSSKRRKYQLLRVRKDLNTLSIRGNIDTRIQKMREQNLDGIILAAAGLKRIGLYNELKDRIQLLPPEIMLPSPGQGALALEIRKDDRKLHETLRSIGEDEVHLEVMAERAFLKAVGGDCHTIMGALASLRGEDIELEAMLGNDEGSVLIRRKACGHRSKGEDLGYQLAHNIMKEMKASER